MFLVIEDSPIVQKILRYTLRQQSVGPVVFASSYAEGQALYEKHRDSLVAAIVDLNLPDAPRGEMVDYLLAEGLPVVVLTGSLDLRQRQSLLNSGAADYVIKENRASYDYAVRMLNRLQRNRKFTALVVDDSTTTRKLICNYLRLLCFPVVEATNGVEAMAILEANPSVSLVITDYHMPEMDGYQLVQNIRHSFDRRPLAVIGLSSQDDPYISVHFIKKGANDFLQKPFLQEEFSCRVTNNIEAIEKVHELRQQADKDFLTNLFNRRFFNEHGTNKVRRLVEAGVPFSVALFDIDHFKQINDCHGHDSGDMVLRQFATYLSDSFSDSFLVSRYGGEEFAMLMPGLSSDKAFDLLDGFRCFIAEQHFRVADDARLDVTVSIGVSEFSNQQGDPLAALLNQADAALYLAKREGRNLVHCYSHSENADYA